MVDFLARIASDSEAVFAGDMARVTELRNAVIAPELRDALARRDNAELAKLLGSRGKVVCGLFAPEDDETVEASRPQARRVVNG